MPLSFSSAEKLLPFCLLETATQSLAAMSSVKPSCETDQSLPAIINARFQSLPAISSVNLSFELTQSLPAIKNA
jgi:hypothetical protein